MSIFLQKTHFIRCSLSKLPGWLAKWNKKLVDQLITLIFCEGVSTYMDLPVQEREIYGASGKKLSAIIFGCAILFSCTFCFHIYVANGAKSWNKGNWSLMENETTSASSQLCYDKHAERDLKKLKKKIDSIWIIHLDGVTSFFLVGWKIEHGMTWCRWLSQAQT